MLPGCEGPCAPDQRPGRVAPFQAQPATLSLSSPHSPKSAESPPNQIEACDPLALNQSFDFPSIDTVIFTDNKEITLSLEVTVYRETIRPLFEEGNPLRLFTLKVMRHPENIAVTLCVCVCVVCCALCVHVCVFVFFL